MSPQELQSTDVVDVNGQSDFPVSRNLSDSNKILMEPEEDEDEDGDVDFNPFLRGSPAEASSSLSSEVEGLDLDVIDSGGEGVQPLNADKALNQADISYDSAVDNSQQIDEGMTRKRVNLEEYNDRKRKTSDSEVGNNVTASDDEDAICRRTRAHYSLASFTLDELETFLQETDDDDDLPNVDDEEEYRKFLSAVLQGGQNEDQTLLDNGNDEDEDNDADFEIEIEEALESDVDDCLVEKEKPKTRQNRCHKASNEGKKKFVEHEKRPLRPLLPMPGSLMVENPPNSHSLNVFTPHQMGQLYCLIHEHVQLLIQVFSLSVLEPSRKNIATHVQGLLSEILNKRDQVLAWRDIPHPSFCFQSPDSQTVKETVETFQTVQGSSWLPIVGGPVLSILDVPPLKFVGKYMDDVSTAVQEQMRRYVEATTDLNSEKQPLFPLPLCLSFANGAATANDGAPVSSDYYSTVASSSSSSPNHRPAKKTLAATLVESSKKQSVALVPKRIAELCRQFYQLFNPALFPHKPPALAVANRVLFTDAEDELLAMGLMEYNTDWKAIQQRFLPCKSKHQIFVRQKNRCSSKAPDNPIKEVRKLKTSPLTEEEKARINEGLSAFKLDWMSIWKLIVPYRDPSLLPRQWRTALGMQKSYKKVDPTMREKRRIYEWNRRRNKTLAAENLPPSDKEDEHPGVQNENVEERTETTNDEAYVHEAFLADWRPPPTAPIPISAQESRITITQPPPPTSTFVCYSRPYRARKSKNTQLVRLAPGLPPVNLPSTVRVIPQAAFQHNITQNKTNITPPSCSKDQENSDLQMHPLLFQSLSSGNAPPNSFSFFPMTPHQVKIPTFQNSIQRSVEQTNTSKKTSSVSLDFHPLLQRTGNVNNCSTAAANELDLEINLNSVPRKDKDLVTHVPPGLNDGADDQSLPEIVMEQEELSDSDEDVENVEFEREEMTDSEGEDEEPYTHQILNTQNQQQQSEARLNMDDHDNCCESTHDIVRSPWLSLNSQGNDNSDAYISSNPSIKRS